MLIQDILPPSMKPTSGSDALKKVQHIHHVTKLSTITSRPPQVRPELRRFSSFDMLPSKPKRSTKSASQKPLIVVRTKQPELSQHQNSIVKELATPSQKIDERSVRARFSDFLQYPLIAIAAVLAANSSAAGQAMIGLYAVFAIFVKMSSKYSLGAAVLLLISIPVFRTLGEIDVSEKFAVYAYELLVIGILQAIIETWLDNRKQKTRHTPSKA